MADGDVSRWEQNGALGRSPSTGLSWLTRGLDLHAIRRRWALAMLELSCAFGVAVAFTVSCRSIDVDPLDRIGQVSGLASIGLRYVVASLVLASGLAFLARFRGGVHFELGSRIACASVAGLASAFVAGGIVVALHGTPWPLAGDGWDAGRLAAWAELMSKRQPRPFYPPLPLRSIVWYARLFELPMSFALKHLQILGTAAMGPLAYASWRLCFSPPWALGIGVLASLPLIDPYKPYANIVLIMLLPVFAAFLARLERADALRTPSIAWLGFVYGSVFAVLFTFYYGWFQWSAPGALCLLALTFPWRRAFRPAAALCGVVGVTFAIFAGRYVWRGLTTKYTDDYFYFDVNTDPAYFAMWRWDLPGAVGEWPPPGELGGVGLFTSLLALGLGVAVGLGRRHLLVKTLIASFASAWLLRFWFAQQMWETKLVRLYPRTSIQLVYCALALCGYAVYLLAARRTLGPERHAELELSAPRLWPAPPATIGLVCGLLLVFGSAGSAIADRYMPSDAQPRSLGYLAWLAQHTPRP